MLCPLILGASCIVACFPGRFSLAALVAAVGGSSCRHLFAYCLAVLSYLRPSRPLFYNQYQLGRRSVVKSPTLFPNGPLATRVR